MGKSNSVVTGNPEYSLSLTNRGSPRFAASSGTLRARPGLRGLARTDHRPLTGQGMGYSCGARRLAFPPAAPGI
jgi:hypothetical protein